MAMTQKFIVSFALSAGACSDVVEGLEEMRVELRKKAAKIGLDKMVEEAPSGSRQVLEAYLDPEVSIEKVLEVSIRTGMRKALEEMRSDDKEGNFQRIGDIKVVRREVPVEAKTECPRCIHNKTCIKVAQAGCKAVTE